MKKSYKNMYAMLLIVIPYALIGMKGPTNNIAYMETLEIRENKNKDGSKEIQYFDNNIPQFSVAQDQRGLVKLTYEAANNQNVEMILTPLMEECPNQYHFTPTPKYFYDVDKTGNISINSKGNITTYYDSFKDLRSYSITQYANSSKEKFYEEKIVALDPYLLIDSSKSMKDFGIKLEIDTNRNNSKIEILYYPDNVDVIKLYSQSGAILFELVIETENDYKARLTTYNSDKSLETRCYKIASISGITTDFRRYQHLSGKK